MSAIAVGVIAGLAGAAGGAAAGYGVGNAQGSSQEKAALTSKLMNAYVANLPPGAPLPGTLQEFLTVAITAINKALTSIPATDVQARAVALALIQLLTYLQNNLPPV